MPCIYDHRYYEPLSIFACIIAMITDSLIISVDMKSHKTEFIIAALEIHLGSRQLPRDLPRQTVFL